jgi:hypothetical protein
MLEIVDHAFSIQKVHGRGQEIPVERLGKADVLLPAGYICNGNDFLERNDLDCRDDADDVNVARKHGNEEEGNHHKRPYCPSDECLLLLLIFGQLRLFLFLYEYVSLPLPNDQTDSPVLGPHLFGNRCGFGDIAILRRTPGVGGHITGI